MRCGDVSSIKRGRRASLGAAFSVLGGRAAPGGLCFSSSIGLGLDPISPIKRAATAAKSSRYLSRRRDPDDVNNLGIGDLRTDTLWTLVSQ